MTRVIELEGVDVDWIRKKIDLWLVSRTRFGFLRLGSLGLSVFLLAAPGYSQWTQFGGPHRSFTVDGVSLALTWPDSGTERALESRARRRLLVHPRRGRSIVHDVPAGGWRRRDRARRRHRQDHLGNFLRFAHRGRHDSGVRSRTHRDASAVGRTPLYCQLDGEAQLPRQAHRRSALGSRSHEGNGRQPFGQRLRP